MSISRATDSWQVMPSVTTPGDIVVHVHKPRLTVSEVRELIADLQSMVDDQAPETPKASPQGIPVRYKHGDVVWTAVEVRPGWWRIKEWGPTMMSDLPTENFWPNFTKVEQ